MPPKPLPFSLIELRQQVDKLDTFVKSAARDVMKIELGPADLGCPSTVVDELAHLHGLLDLARCCVQEIEIYQAGDPELEKFFEIYRSLQDETEE